MWVYQVVRCPFITQEERYARWPAVFPSNVPIQPNKTKHPILKVLVYQGRAKADHTGEDFKAYEG